MVARGCIPLFKKEEKGVKVRVEVARTTWLGLDNLKMLIINDDYQRLHPLNLRNWTRWLRLEVEISFSTLNYLACFAPSRSAKYHFSDVFHITESDLPSLRDLIIDHEGKKEKSNRRRKWALRFTLRHQSREAVPRFEPMPLVLPCHAIPCQWHSEIRRDGNQKALEWGALIHQNSWSLNPIQTIICNERHKSAILGMMVKSGRMRESFVGVFAAVAATKCSGI